MPASAPEAGAASDGGNESPFADSGAAVAAVSSAVDATEGVDSGVVGDVSALAGASDITDDEGHASQSVVAENASAGVLLGICAEGAAADAEETQGIVEQDEQSEVILEQLNVAMSPLLIPIVCKISP